MIKKIVLINSVLYHKRTAVFLLSLLLSISVFVIVVFFEEYAYLYVPYESVAESDFLDSVYFIGYFDVNRSDDYSTHEELQDYMNADADTVRKEISSFAAFDSIIEPQKCILSLDGKEHEAVFYPDSFLKRISVSTDKGRWFDVSAETDEAVLVGEKWNNRSVGDTITFDDGSSAVVVGLMKGNTMVPFFHGSVYYAGDLFNQADGYILLSSPSKVFDGKTFGERKQYFIINYKPDATESQKDELSYYLNQHGTIIDFHTVIDNTEEYMSNWVSIHFPVPTFLIAVATVCFLSLCTSVIHRSVNEQAKYMIIGCSKKKSVLLIIEALVISFALPVASAFCIAINYQTILHLLGRPYSRIYCCVDSRCVIPAFAYILFLLACGILIPALYYSKKSPLGLYLKEK